MKIATWNVNSIRARLDRVYAWLKLHRPDVLCIQESKCTDALFPHRELALLGYRALFYGQKSYNGVALLSLHPIEDPWRGFLDLAPEGAEQEDAEARLVAATICGIRIISAYVPNGQAVGSAKYAYKLRWLERLRADYLDRYHSPEEPLLLCGDFNVAPEDRDVHDPRQWRDSIITHHQVRDAFDRVLDFGLHDTFRQLHGPTEGDFTWWDYRPSSLKENKGVRIDFLLATEPLREACREVQIDLEERAGEKPSDHAPLVLTLDW